MLNYFNIFVRYTYCTYMSQSSSAHDFLTITLYMLYFLPVSLLLSNGVLTQNEAYNYYIEVTQKRQQQM